MSTQACPACTTTYPVGSPACPHCGHKPEGGGSVLPSVVVVCRTAGCTYEGRWRRVMLRPVAPGLVELPQLLCTGCGLVPPTEEESMAKIRQHGGPTNNAPGAIADEPAVEVAEVDVPDQEEASGDVPEQTEEDPSAEAETTEEVAPSAGSSSETSSPKPPSNDGPSKPARRKPARTTGSRSSGPRTGGSTARGTGGDQTDSDPAE